MVLYIIINNNNVSTQVDIHEFLIMLRCIVAMCVQETNMVNTQVANLSIWSSEPKLFLFTEFHMSAHR